MNERKYFVITGRGEREGNPMLVPHTMCSFVNFVNVVLIKIFVLTDSRDECL